MLDIDEEDLFLLRYYLSIPNLIKKLEYSASLIAKEFYSSHSFLGTAILDYESLNYQRSISTEKAAIELYCSEKAHLK